MDNISVRSLTPTDPDIDKVKNLMYTLFPEDEQSTIEELLQINNSMECEFHAYYCSNEFLGFSFVIYKCGIVYLHYLAIDEAFQSMGYGTHILKSIKQTHKDALVVLDIEPLDESAQNYNQRIHRWHFYEKNGFHLTPYYLYHEGVEYQVVSSSGLLHTENYRMLLEDIAPEYKQSTIYSKQT